MLIEEGANLHIQGTRAGALRVRCLAAAEGDEEHEDGLATTRWGPFPTKRGTSALPRTSASMQVPSDGRPLVHRPSALALAREPEC